jgi:hypothetical protein
MEKFEASVRRRVHQGISLVGILCAFRLGTKELWLAHLDLAEHDNALRDELLFVISPYRLEYSDFMAQFIGRVFLDEQFQQTSWRAIAARALRGCCHAIVGTRATTSLQTAWPSAR